MPVMLDEFAERLAGNIDPRIQRMAGLGPRFRTVAENEDVPIAECGSAGSGACRDAVAIVVEHNAHRDVRRQRGQGDLETAVGPRNGKKQMSATVLSMPAYIVQI